MFKNYIIRNILLLLFCSIVVLLLAFQGLKWYTHHGEALVLPDYVDKPLDSSIEDATENSFRIEVTDSLFLVGRPGGLIIQQNPDPGSKVKRNRKIYVTITKSNADMIPIQNLPRLYGEKYDIKSNELLKGYEIKSKVVDKIYDAGLPDMIMEVRYDGKTIIDRDGRKNELEVPKGGTLEFVLSQKTGGSIPIPKLKCSTYDEAKGILELSGLVIGDRITDGSQIDNPSDAFITDQEPSYLNGGTISIGDTIHVFLSSNKPEDCDE